LLEPHAENKLRHLRGRGLRGALTEDNPTTIWAYNLLRTKHFHGVPSAGPHVYSLKSRYGKVSLLLPVSFKIFKESGGSIEYAEYNSEEN
jgi:hypothetical protein